MAKKKSSPSVEHTGSMLEQKTFQDFNNREPSLSDPNESKGKVNPETPNLADQAKDPVADEIKEEMKPLPSTLGKRTRRLFNKRPSVAEKSKTSHKKPRHIGAIKRLLIAALISRGISKIWDAVLASFPQSISE